MSRRRVKMRQIREVLRYNFDLKLSYERTGNSLNISKGSVHNILKRFKSSELKWPISNDLTDCELEECLFPKLKPDKSNPLLPDIAEIHKELSRPHVTAQLLWEEYIETTPDGLSRSSFFRYLQKHKIGRNVTMKMIHKGGDKLFVDYSGDSLEYVEAKNGILHKTELFISSWGASSYSYAEVTESQKSDDFIYSHVRSFEYFGVIPNGIVPDNLKSAVTKASRYEPTINTLYSEMAKHYNTAIIPARVRKPQDKAVVESNVLHIQRYILARLRNRQFFSLHEINNAISELLVEYNDRPMKDYGGQSRKERFLELDKPYAKELPIVPFRYTCIKLNIKVSLSCHVRYKKHFYSVPHELVGQKVDVFQSGNIVEIYHENIHKCRHVVSNDKFGYTTKTEHLPPQHQYMKALSPEWLVGQADKIGKFCVEIIKNTLYVKEHMEQAFNAAQGLLNLSRMYSPERVEKACERAIYHKSLYYKTVKSILETSLDKEPLLNEEPITNIPIEHENVRGSKYYREDTICM